MPGPWPIFFGRLEESIEQQTTFTPALERILQVPGIGLVTGWSILAEVGQIQRFPTDKKFVSYCRLVPGSNDSGGSRRHKSANKDGYKYLRRLSKKKCSIFENLNNLSMLCEPSSRCGFVAINCQIIYHEATKTQSNTKNVF